MYDHSDEAPHVLIVFVKEDEAYYDGDLDIMEDCGDTVELWDSEEYPYEYDISDPYDKEYDIP